MFFINKSVTTQQRYDLQRFIERLDGAYEFINSYIIAKVQDLKIIGMFTIRNAPYRPDLISYEIYGDTQYWPFLMEYNHILELEELKIGTQINYFSLEELEDIYLTLTSKQFTT